MLPSANDASIGSRSDVADFSASRTAGASSSIDRERLALGADLQIERASTRQTDGASREEVGLVELAKHRHEGLRSFSDAPVELTVSTIGEESVYMIAVTEHVEITIRWKRSRGVPVA
ncbi:MAG: hypothetical protein RIR54_925 [Actinomycetota bacterium]